MVKRHHTHKGSSVQGNVRYSWWWECGFQPAELRRREQEKTDTHTDIQKTTRSFIRSSSFFLLLILGLLLLLQQGGFFFFFVCWVFGTHHEVEEWVERSNRQCCSQTTQPEQHQSRPERETYTQTDTRTEIHTERGERERGEVVEDFYCCRQREGRRWGALWQGWVHLEIADEHSCSQDNWGTSCSWAESEEEASLDLLPYCTPLIFSPDSSQIFLIQKCCTLVTTVVVVVVVGVVEPAALLPAQEHHLLLLLALRFPLVA